MKKKEVDPSKFKFKKIHYTEEEKAEKKALEKAEKEANKEKKRLEKSNARGGLVSTSSVPSYTIEEIEAAIRKTGGYLLHTSEELRCPVSVLKKAIESSATLKKAFFETRESCLDIAESKLMDQVEGGNLLAIMFYLKCQGKGRGWVEKPETKTGSSSQKPLYIKIMPIDGDGNSSGRPKKMYEEKKVIPDENEKIAALGTSIETNDVMDAEFEDING